MGLFAKWNACASVPRLARERGLLRRSVCFRECAISFGDSAFESRAGLARVLAHLERELFTGGSRRARCRAPVFVFPPFNR